MRYNIKKGLQVFENTTITDYNLSSTQSVLTTDAGFTITANQVIICTGYDALEWFKHEKPFYTLSRSFAILTKPVKSFMDGKKNVSSVMTKNLTLTFDQL